MAGVRYVEETMRIAYPHTLNALQHLVMAMADINKNAGKKTIFGQDKGVRSYRLFLEKLRDTIHAMILDNIISQATPSAQVAEKLLAKLNLFSQAFPSWQDAYVFAAYFFGTTTDDAIATIERLRA